MSLFQRNHSTANFLFSYSPSVFSLFKTKLFPQQRWQHCESSGKGGRERTQDESLFCPLNEGLLDTSVWKTVDSRKYGITRSSISPSTRTVLKILQVNGYEAYLVGGCVRDLLLGKTPKDYDVVTTASLREIKKNFHRSFIVGSRFPICHVFISGNMIEVSSFETIPTNSIMRNAVSFSHMSNLCDQKNFVRWRDSMRRDFTVNGLFYDPFVDTIYDYVDGIRDIMASKVRTVIPAQVSFKEDSARILRGLRIAARLGLRFSNETAKAMQDLSPSITTLSKGRLMMELNLMLAYGAAVPSIYLLQKYKLLGVFLPIQAAYLDDQAKKNYVGNSTMLMKLFSHYDKLFGADHPSSFNLWMSLLAFHMALVNNPQKDIVIWTFASVLYFGTWDRGINFVREKVKGHVKFVPEILEISTTTSDELKNVEANLDELIAEKTSQLASLVKQSIYALNCHRDLLDSLNKYHIGLPCSDAEHLVFISERAGESVAKIFCVLEHDIKYYVRERESFNIDYRLLKKGDEDENRYVLGKIILDTLHSELSRQNNQNVNVQTSNVHRSNVDISHDKKRRNFNKYTSHDNQNQNVRMHISHDTSNQNLRVQASDDSNTNENASLDKSYVSKNQKDNAEIHISNSNMDRKVMVEIEKPISSPGHKKSASVNKKSVKKNQNADIDAPNSNKNQDSVISSSIKNIVDNIDVEMKKLFTSLGLEKTYEKKKCSVSKNQKEIFEHLDSKNQNASDSNKEAEMCTANDMNDIDNASIEKEKPVSSSSHKKTIEKKKSVRKSGKKNQKANMENTYETSNSVNVEKEKEKLVLSSDDNNTVSEKKKSVRKSGKKNQKANMENTYETSNSVNVEKEKEKLVLSSDDNNTVSEKKKSVRKSVKKNQKKIITSNENMGDNVNVEVEKLLPVSGQEKTKVKKKSGLVKVKQNTNMENSDNKNQNVDATLSNHEKTTSKKKKSKRLSVKINQTGNTDKSKMNASCSEKNQVAGIQSSNKMDDNANVEKKSSGHQEITSVKRHVQLSSLFD